MATSFQVRPVTEGELPAFEYVDQHAFNGRPDTERSRSNWHARLERAKRAVEFQAGVPVGPGPLGIRPAVERVLVDVFERGKLALGDRADLERGGHARLSTRPAG